MFLISIASFGVDGHKTKLISAVLSGACKMEVAVLKITRSGSKYIVIRDEWAAELSSDNQMLCVETPGGMIDRVVNADIIMSVPWLGKAFEMTKCFKKI